MDRFINALKGYAAALDTARAEPRFGIVTSVNPALATARVQLQPEGVLSGWLPILSPWIGAGWGMFAPPSPGDQVLVVCQEGSAEHGIVVGGVYTASRQPPTAQVGEIAFAHASGAMLRLGNDGTIHVSGPVTIQGTVTVAGDVKATGDVFDSIGPISRLRSHFDAHLHIDSRGGTTSQPTVQD